MKAKTVTNEVPIDSPVRSARKAAGLTQVQLAAKARTSVTMISIIERSGGAFLSDRMRARLAVALGISPDQLATPQHAA